MAVNRDHFWRNFRQEECRQGFPQLHGAVGQVRRQSLALLSTTILDTITTTTTTYGSSPVPSTAARRRAPVDGPHWADSMVTTLYVLLFLTTSEWDASGAAELMRQLQWFLPEALQYLHFY